MASSIVRKIIFTPKAPKPIGPYSQAVLVGRTLYLSGQIGMNLNGELVQGGIEAQMKLTLENLGHVLNAAGMSYKNVVKTSVLLADIKHVPLINEIYGQYFTENHPARAAYQVAALPKNALVEIEAVAVLEDTIDAKL